MRTFLCVAALTTLTAGALALGGCTADDSSSDDGTDGGVSGDATTGSDGAATLPSDAGLGDSSVVMTDDGPGAVTADVACASQSRARCLRNDSCSNNTANVRSYGTEAECEARLTAQCETTLLAPGSGATASSVEACAESLPSEDCEAFLGEEPTAACVPQNGTGALGAVCVASAQCASGWCSIAQHGACGTCAALPTAGASCAANADCGGRNGLACLNTICTSYADAGAACGASTECQPGFACIGADGGATCQAQANTVGAACDSKRITAPSCDANFGLACVGGSCAVITEVGTGETCGTLDGGAVVHCSASGTCVLGVTDGGAAKVGTCLGAAADTVACDTTAGPACLPPARCVVTLDGGTSGTCQTLNAANCH